MIEHDDEKTPERPILFSAPMVRAILAGTKTQTRRVVNPQPHAGVRKSPFVPSGLEDGHGREIRAKYGKPGDRLWVRETWTPWLGLIHSVAYAAGWAEGQLAETLGGLTEDQQVWLERWAHKHGEFSAHDHTAKWSPAIHMPRWASRLTLELTDIRIERLQDISEADSKAEGVEPVLMRNIGTYPEWMRLGMQEGKPHRIAFAQLWESLNGKREGCAWTDNPWCWVVAFKRVEVANANQA